MQAMASAAKKKIKSAPTLDRQEPKPIQLPDKLAHKQITPRSLAKGSYQKAVLASVAHIILPDLMNSIRRNLHLNNTQTEKLVAEIFGIAGKPGTGIVLNVNQNNQNVSESHSRRGSDGPVSFEDIARVLEEESQKRKAIPATFEASYEATPDSLVE